MSVGMYSKQLGEVSDASGKDKLVSRVAHLGGSVRSRAAHPTFRRENRIRREELLDWELV
jgi:hypothetical protein